MYQSVAERKGIMTKMKTTTKIKTEKNLIQTVDTAFHQPALFVAYGPCADN